MPHDAAWCRMMPHDAAWCRMMLFFKEKKKFFFLFVYFLWWEQVELSGQKVSGREICCFFKEKNIFFSPRESLWLEQVEILSNWNLELGYQICSDLINLSSDLSSRVRDWASIIEPREIFFFSFPRNSGEKCEVHFPGQEIFFFLANWSRQKQVELWERKIFFSSPAGPAAEQGEVFYN